MVYVVGCNHGIQPRDPDWLAGDTEAAEQKKLFAELIEATAKADETKFVAEEWGLPYTTSAHSIADKLGLPWCDINTCFHDLDRLGIPRDYVNGSYTTEKKEHWNREREKVMLKRIKAGIKGKPNGIVICGFEHMGPLVELLRGEGIETGSVNYRQKEWYQPTFSGDS